MAKATDRFTTDSLQYQHSWTVPEGVITTTVELVGAGGGGVGGIAGRVDATLTNLSPGTSLTICLGGGGLQATAFHGGGGIGGGGNAPPGAYGGGGSTDIRLAASCTVGADTRLFVAGGGGGMGGQSSDGRVGGFGGSVIDAAQAGVSYGDEFFLHVTGGGGGGAASTLANGSGGPGGVAGNTDARLDVNIGAAGGSGLGTVGGSGGQPASGLADEGHVGFFSGGGGGGGGGGYFAGGGGGGGGFYRGGGALNLVPPGATGGGGGGAGSNCAGLSPYTTCAGSATSITATLRADNRSFRQGNVDGYVEFWYPDVSIQSPAAEASFEQDAFASASFSCDNDNVAGEPTCVGVVTKPDGSTVSVLSGGALPTDSGGSYTLSVTAVDFLGDTRRLTRSYSVVAATPPANTELPAVSGAPVVGETLEATQGSWTGTAPIDYSYRWQTCHDVLPCTDIDGEAGEGPTHTVTAADRGDGNPGDALRVIVTALNALGSVSAESARTLPIKSTPELPDNFSVAIEGVLEEGQTLTQRFEPSFYITHPDFERVVKWYRCTSLICVWEPIPGATGPSYVLTGDDVGATISVVVQLKSYSILSQAYGAATGRIAAADDQPPELSITPVAADAVAGTGWYNRVTSGGDGVEVDVVAADPSGVSSLVCRDGNEVVLDVDGASGSIVLGDGRHAIECVATDTRSNAATANAQFDVDQTAPVVTVPAPMTVSATSTAGAAVTYVSGATDNLDPSPRSSARPPRAASSWSRRRPCPARRPTRPGTRRRSSSPSRSSGRRPARPAADRRHRRRYRDEPRRQGEGNPEGRGRRPHTQCLHRPRPVPRHGHQAGGQGEADQRTGGLPHRAGQHDQGHAQLLAGTTHKDVVNG